jgi:hypothetical protein
MAIENRDLAVGTKLAGRHKKTEHTCEVVQTDEGVRYQLADGRSFKSPSSAASAVMGGVSANRWRFWSVEGTLPEAKPSEPDKPDKAKTKDAKNGRMVRQIKRLPNQKGVDAGQTKWFCSACMESFLAETGTEPEACPKGHPAQVEDELAPPA